MNERSRLYVEAYAAYEAKRQKIMERVERARRQIARVDKQLCNLNQPLWWEMLVVPIKDSLEERYRHLRFKTVGPFGIGPRINVNAYENTECVGSITFEPIDLNKGEIGIVDYSTHVSEYPKGSIGEMNDLVYKANTMPETFDELCVIFEASFATFKDLQERMK